MTSTSKRKRPARRRNPVARALRLAKPRVVPKAKAYSRKRLGRPNFGDE